MAVLIWDRRPSLSEDTDGRSIHLRSCILGASWQMYRLIEDEIRKIWSRIILWHVCDSQQTISEIGVITVSGLYWSWMIKYKTELQHYEHLTDHCKSWFLSPWLPWQHHSQLPPFHHQWSSSFRLAAAADSWDCSPELVPLAAGRSCLSPAVNIHTVWVRSHEAGARLPAPLLQFADGSWPSVSVSRWCENPWTMGRCQTLPLLQFTLTWVTAICFCIQMGDLGVKIITETMPDSQLHCCSLHDRSPPSAFVSRWETLVWAWSWKSSLGRCQMHHGHCVAIVDIWPHAEFTDG